MAIRIIGIRLEGGYSHQHISQLKWINEQTYENGVSTREVIVDFIDNQGGKAYVDEGGYRAYVYVRTPNVGPKFLQTYADGKWQDNLLSLPKWPNW